MAETKEEAGEGITRAEKTRKAEGRKATPPGQWKGGC
jgi:hypothetical protein